MPRVAAKLTSSGAGCTQRVGHLFALDASGAENVLAQEWWPRGSIKVGQISWHGDRATASSTGPESGQKRRWRLSLLHGRWRIASRATLQLRPDCGQHPFATTACPQILTLRPADPGET